MSDNRYPLHVRIRGIMYKGNSKLYVTSVLWSDHTEVIVYRSLRDFRQLHRELKKKISVDNQFRQQDRVLPRFGGLLMKLNLQRKIPTRCVQRVKSLERYCTELLNCGPQVTRSSDLINFFIPKEEELHPEFAQNSLMIFQPEDVTNDQSRDDLKRRFSVGNVSQPYIGKLYRCLAPYETKDTKNRQFSVKLNETLEVLIKDQAGWWLVENEHKHLAWFPAPYLELCEDEEETEEFDIVDGQPDFYCAIRNYTSDMKDEVSVNIGALVEVIQKSDDGWWLIRYNGKAGYVPSMYLQPYTNPMFSMQKKLHASNLNLSNLSTVRSHFTHKAQFHKFLSLDVLSEFPDCSTTIQRGEKMNSCKSSISDDTDFCSSSLVSLGLSGSEEEENPRQGSDSPDSVLSMDTQSLTNSEISSPSKLYPKVPPRPQTQEILTRCTTYTRKAALETQSRLFSRTRI